MPPPSHPPHAARLARGLSRMLVLTLLTVSLQGCRNMPESMDSAWRRLDPTGHHRYHTEAYYPNERRMGVRLPKSLDE